MFQTHQTNDLLNAPHSADVIIKVFSGNSPHLHIDQVCFNSVSSSRVCQEKHPVGDVWSSATQTIIWCPVVPV